jgi:hypothetical protein
MMCQHPYGPGPDPDDEEWFEAEDLLEEGQSLEDLSDTDADEIVHARFDREGEDEPTTTRKGRSNDGN